MAPAWHLRLLLAAATWVAGDGAELEHAGSHGGFCYAWYHTGKAWEWCWTMDSPGKKAQSQCSRFNSMPEEEGCYQPAPPADDTEDARGEGSHANHAEADAEDASGDWQCNTRWYVGGTPKDAEAKAWTMGHNVFRCMHDVPFVRWSNPMADDVKSYLAPLKSMVHSDSYAVKPPAGPAGENLFWGGGSGLSYWKPGSAVSSWYSEVKLCPSQPGCGGGFHMQTGHLTAMVWRGVEYIGCTSNRHNLKACRYKPEGSQMDCRMPNMQGCYKKNVNGATKSFSKCKSLVEKCFGTGLPAKLQLDAVLDQPIESEIQGPKTFDRALIWMAGGGVTLTSFLLAALRLLKQRTPPRSPEPQGPEADFDRAALLSS